MINHFENILEEFQTVLNFKVDEEIKQNTPKRLADMFIQELLSGYTQNPKDILAKRFYTKNEDMIIVKDISFVALCEHHWMPFSGVAHFAYIPKNGEIVGLSKIPRLVQCYAKRFNTQETMTHNIADSFQDIVQPYGCILVTEAQHLCAQIRGIKALGSKMICSAIRGNFSNPHIKEEFFKLIK